MKSVVQKIQNEATLTKFINGTTTHVLTVLERIYWVPGTLIWVMCGAVTMKEPFDFGFYELLLGIMDIIAYSTPMILCSHQIVRKMNMKSPAEENKCPADSIFLLGYGSLLSPASARKSSVVAQPLCVKLPGYRRTFDHPEVYFFNLGISRLDTLEIACLTAEPSENPKDSVVCYAYNMGAGAFGRMAKREQSYEWSQVEAYVEGSLEPITVYMVTTGTEAACKRRLTCAKYSTFLKAGYLGIWMYGPSSGILPCREYLYHCLSSAARMSSETQTGISALENFLDSTYLVDRRTTIREYLNKHPEVLTAKPLPAALTAQVYQTLTPKDLAMIHELLMQGTSNRFIEIWTSA